MKINKICELIKLWWGCRRKEVRGILNISRVKCPSCGSKDLRFANNNKSAFYCASCDELFFK